MFASQLGIEYEHIKRADYHLEGEGCSARRPWLGQETHKTGVTIYIHLQLKSALQRRLHDLRDLHTGNARCILSFRCGNGLYWNPDLSMRFGFESCDAGIELKNLPFHVHDQVVQALQASKNKKLKKMVKMCKHDFSYNTAIRTPKLGNVWVKVDDGLLAIDIVADLFADPGTADNEIEIRVTIHASAREMPLESLAQCVQPIQHEEPRHGFRLGNATAQPVEIGGIKAHNVLMAGCAKATPGTSG